MIGSRRNFLRCGLAMAGAAMLRPISGVAGEQWTLTLYNGQHAQTTKAVVAGFLESTGIAVTVRNGSSAQLASQIAEEGAHSPATPEMGRNMAAPAIANPHRKKFRRDPIILSLRSSSGLQ